MRALLLLPISALVACTFPGVDLADDATADSSIANDSGVDTSIADTGVDTGIVDTGTSVDTGIDTNPIDANDPCDLDHDGFKVATCNPPPAVGQADCDDHSANVRPNINTLIDLDPTKEPGPWSLVGDWNCDGNVTKRYTTGGFSCVGLSVTGCSGSGFDGTVTCGASGNFITCGKSGLGCAAVSSSPAIEGCE